MTPAPLDPSKATAQIDAMLAAAPADQRAALQTLRETIAATAPEAVETISYSMPAFRYHKRALVSYSAFKKHCSLFPMSGELIEHLGDEVAGFATAKGTLQFTPEHPIPKALVERIVRERMAQIDAKLGR
ncbi:MAG: iron chaperone [Candidatus Limnocylindrales bacterium]